MRLAEPRGGIAIDIADTAARAMQRAAVKSDCVTGLTNLCMCFTNRSPMPPASSAAPSGPAQGFSLVFRADVHILGGIERADEGEDGWRSVGGRKRVRRGEGSGAESRDGHRGSGHLLRMEETRLETPGLQACIIEQAPLSTFVLPVPRLYYCTTSCLPPSSCRIRNTRTQSSILRLRCPPRLRRGSSKSWSFPTL